MIRKMSVNIMHDINNLRIIQFCVQKLHAVFDGGAVQVYHEFQKQQLAVERAGILLILKGTLQAVRNPKKRTFL